MPVTLSGLFTRPSSVVAACTVGNAVGPTPMVFTVFGLFLIPLTSEFGWSRSSASFVLFIMSITSAIGYPIVGRMIDRYGARKIILPGNLLFALAVASVSLIDAKLIHFYLAYTFIGITAALTGSMVYTKVVTAWFDSNRGLFLGIVGGLGNGIGAALSPAFALILISNFGWRGGHQGIAAVIFLVGFTLMFLLLWDPPNAIGQKTTDSSEEQGMSLNEACRSGTFWIILGAIGLAAGCMTAIFTHMVPMLIDRGLSDTRATLVLTVFSVVTAAWQICVGFILDKIPKPWIAVPFYISALLGLLFLQFSTDYYFLLLAGVFLGIGLGTEYGMLPYFISRYFGIRHYGAISGAVYSLVVLIQGLTPFLMALVFDMTSSYTIAITVIAVGLLCGAGLILRLKPYRYMPQTNN